MASGFATSDSDVRDQRQGVLTEATRGQAEARSEQWLSLAGTGEGELWNKGDSCVILGKTLNLSGSQLPHL